MTTDTFRAGPVITASHRLLAAISLILVLSVLIPLAVGFGIDAEQICTVFLLLAIAGQIRTVRLIIFVLNLPVVFYLPTGMIYGKPHAGILASVLETNPLEAQEFLATLPASLILLSLAVISQ